MVHEEQDGWCFVQATKDGYVGYVRSAQMRSGGSDPTHWVTAPATHLYSAADFKSREYAVLSHGSLIQVIDEEKNFMKSPDGFIPRQHLRPLEFRFTDPVAVAELFLGSPYLWGGNSPSGIDCSGLVQAALLGCGIACPGDSGLQETSLGKHTNDHYRRNDLLFWKGHVAMVADAHTLIHANVWHMAVAYEPIDTAIERIEAQGDGPVTAHLRLPEV